jgi:hypothetical protein
MYFVYPLLFWDVHAFMKLVIGQYSNFNFILKSTRWSRGLTSAAARPTFRRGWSLHDMYPRRELICLCSMHILYSNDIQFIWTSCIRRSEQYRELPLCNFLQSAFCIPTLSLCFVSVSLRRPPTKYGLFSRVHYEHNQHVSYATNPAVVNAN